MFVDAEEEDRGIPQCECGGPVYKHGMRTISVRDSSIRRKPTILRLKRRRYSFLRYHGIHLSTFEADLRERSF